jgi:hypothetical protein
MAETRSRRDRLLTGLAIAMGLLAISNAWKPVAQALAPHTSAGFVLFGQRLHGIANAVVGPAFGLVLAAYAYGVWTMRRWALPIAFAYAAYVIVNLVLFVVRVPPAEDPGLLGMLVYAAVAIGVSSGGALHLHRRRADLA